MSLESFLKEIQQAYYSSEFYLIFTKVMFPFVTLFV